MGREVRRVPPNWEHPKDSKGDYLSMFDEDYDSAATEWLTALQAWEAGEDPQREKSGYRYYWDWEQGPPAEESYRSAFTEEPTWFQAYETVSEGTPVSPPFSTEEELARYLSDNGDLWFQRRLQEGRRDARLDIKPSYEDSLVFVKSGWAPSMWASPTGVHGPYEPLV